MRDIVSRLLEGLILVAKMVLSSRRCAYFCMSYMMLIMSHEERIFVLPRKKFGFGRMTLGLWVWLWSLLEGPGSLAGQPGPPEPASQAVSCHFIGSSL